MDYIISTRDFIIGTQLLENLFDSTSIKPIEEYIIDCLYLAYGYYLQEKWIQSKKYWLLIQDNNYLLSVNEKIIFEHIMKQSDYFELLSTNQ